MALGPPRPFIPGNTPSVPFGQQPWLQGLAAQAPGLGGTGSNPLLPGGVPPMQGAQMPGAPPPLPKLGSDAPGGGMTPQQHMQLMQMAQQFLGPALSARQGRQ